jgi:hypothetical protein
LPHFAHSDRTALPAKLPLRVWITAILAFLAAYGFMWSYVHVRVDMRPCVAQLPDPLFAFIPYNRSFYWVSHEIYEFITIGAVIGLVWQAVRGDHRGLVRWGTGLTVQAVLRSITLLLLPLCRMTVAPGTVDLKEVPLLDLGLFKIPWRVWASNDLVFSGHIGEFLLLYWATWNWPKPWRVFLVLFQFVQAYALLATRGHYTIDLVVAVPCAYFADGMAVNALAWLSRPRALAAT